MGHASALSMLLLAVSFLITAINPPLAPMGALRGASKAQLPHHSQGATPKESSGAARIYVAQHSLLIAAALAFLRRSPSCLTSLMTNDPGLDKPGPSRSTGATTSTCSKSPPRWAFNSFIYASLGPRLL